MAYIFVIITFVGAFPKEFKTLEECEKVRSKMTIAEGWGQITPCRLKGGE